MSDYFLRVLNLPAFFISPTLFDFVTSFLKKKINIFIRIFNYGFAVCLTFFVFSPYFAYDLHPSMGKFLWFNAGPIFSVYLFEFLVISIYAFWSLWDSFQQSKDKAFRHQLKLILIGLIISYLGGSTNFLPWYNIPIPPVANCTVIGYVVLITYAILKYQLMDIQIIIKNSLVYSVLASLITVLYFMVIYIAEHILKKAIGYHSAFASLATAILVAMFFIPVKNFIQGLIEKYIFKATYSQITEQNDRLRRQLMISERYKTFSEIAKSVTFAIRDPLTTLKTYSYHFKNRMDDKSFLEKFEKVLSKEIQKIQDLTDGLGQYSSPEPLNIQRTEIYAVINTVLEGMQHQLTSQKINLQHYYNENESFWMLIDPKQIQQVVTNILLNSFKTMPNGGQLWVGAEKNDETFSILIKDTGSPIPKDQLEKVFDPFYRYQEENNGLNLAIAFSIIENHGGKIFVESHQDAGNEFTIQLPVTKNNVFGI